MPNPDEAGAAAGVPSDWTLPVRLMEHLVLPTFVLDSAGRVIIWNRACERLTGLAAADVLGTKNHWRGFYREPRPCLADLVLLGDTSEITELYAAHTYAVRGQTGLSAENWCPIPLLGELRYLAIEAGPVCSDDGKLLAVVETLRDMTALKQGQIALEANRKQLDVALANMAQGLAMFDGDGKLVISNRHYAEVYGIDPEAIRPGMSHREILKLRVAAGAHTGDPDEYLRERTEVLAQSSNDRVLELENGRTIAVSHRAMEGGGSVSTHEDITERRQAEAKVEFLARHDALTGLPNRMLFREEMERALARVRRGERLAALCLDLDRFKPVNDTLGHAVGDALLKVVAQRIAACVRDTDVVARLGGDEFAVVQVGIAAPDQTIGLAQRLIDALSAPYDLDGRYVSIGASVGVAMAPDDGATPEDLLKAADMALYRAKSEGRGVFRFFEPEMDAKMQLRRALELDLRAAVRDERFEVHYQPIIDLATNRVSSCEALLRWDHPERGRVSPADFVPLAEEIGLINQIGAWVLNKACAEAVTWPKDVRLAVNLSPAQFRSKTLVLDVVAALGRSGLPGRRLELEITETVMLHDTEGTLATLHELRALGVRISMDDFGTGYSSLSYLRKFPFDKIKIDRSFIQDLPNGPEAHAIIRAVAGIGTSLGIATTAEGVETETQLERLRSEGCTEVQGWLFSAARPAHEIRPFLALMRRRARAA